MAEKLFIELKDFKGEISYKGSSISIEFQLTCGMDGRITISPSLIPLSPESKFLLKAGYSTSRVFEQLAVVGKNEDGIRIKSEYVYITSISLIGLKNIELKISTNDLSIFWKEQEEVDSPDLFQIRYLVPGLRCFRGVSVEAPFGKVNVQGKNKVTNYNELSGFVEVETHLNGNLLASEQLRNIDASVTRLLEILSLADNRFMKWSIREVISDTQLLSTLFRGPMPSSEPRFPLFPFLNFKPIVSVAIKHYTEDLRKNTGMDVAIAWFLINPRYMEAEFLSGMTALEHLLHVFVETNPQGGIFSKNIFKSYIRQPLEKTLEEMFRTMPNDEVLNLEETKTILLSKLGGLNQRTFQTNLQNFLAEYNVPISNINKEVPILIKIRNDIVHKGFQEEKELTRDLTYYSAVLHELLSRIFLTLIGYKGRYNSYLNGLEGKQFPPEEEKQGTTNDETPIEETH